MMCYLPNGSFSDGLWREQLGSVLRDVHVMFEAYTEVSDFSDNSAVEILRLHREDRFALLTIPLRMTILNGQY